MNRPGLNPQEAALLTMIVGCEQDARARLIERIEPTSRGAMLTLCERFDALDEVARDDALVAWKRLDAMAHDVVGRVAALPMDRRRLLESYLDSRWSRAMELAAHADDPLTPTLSTPYTLALCARILCDDMNLGHERPDLLPNAEHEAFDLAHFYEWSVDELLALSQRLGYMMCACSLVHQDRRAVARRLHALSPKARQIVMQDMKADFVCDGALIKRADEVLIALQKRQYASIDEMLTSLGLYMCAVAAGRRLSDRALNLADRLPQPFGADLHSFVRQHRTSSRRGLEPLAAAAIEQLLDHLADLEQGAPS